MYTKQQIPTPFLQQPIHAEHQTTPSIAQKTQPNPIPHTTVPQKNTACTNPAVLVLAFLLLQGEH